MGAWRMLRLEIRKAFMNMAIDEAVLKARIAGMVPNTLRFYRWKPSAVSLGRFQRASDEVHVEDCRRRGIDIVRRITGGGAVYHDYEGEITYSVIVSEEDVGSKDVVSAYNIICRGLVEAAKILGVTADFNLGDPEQCPNITVDRRKFSGSAQLHRRGVLLQHGTFLVQTDLKKMFTFLKVPWAKSLEDVLRVAQKRLTSIESELQSSISNEEAHEALTRGFQKAFDTELVEGNLTDYEEGLAEELCKEKYATDAWNFKGDNAR
ncbi:MAG: lipoate--protein ligase family protein [Candidatus Bathyarchaeota archaeon]|nr:MAG: lipoate--protein ligase family protein [Candidatus Bathyarchaeota archaeon]